MLKDLKKTLHKSRIYNKLVFLKVLRGKIYDIRHNVNTLSKASLEELTIESENLKHGVEYAASDPRTIKKIFNEFNIRHEDFVFVDLGSGKGRVLFLASDYPYKKIIGVEFAAELDATAKKNIKNYRSKNQKCKNIEAIHLDAAKFQIPEDPVVFFICNPFGEKVLSQVLKNIENSLENSPREIYIFYLVTFHRHILDKSEKFKEIESSDWHILYKSVLPQDKNSAA